MTSNGENNHDPAMVETVPKGEDVESLATFLDSCSVEALKMVLQILQALQKHKTGLGT